VLGRTRSIALLATMISLMVAPVWAQSTGPAISELSTGSVYVEAGAEAIDISAAQRAISTAAGFDIDLKVAVFAGGNAEQLASEIADGLGSVTVLAFTPSSFGVFSDEVSQSRLEKALDEAGDDLRGPDAAAGAVAFADALAPSDDSGGISTGLVLAGVVAVLVIVGVGGRIWEVRTREARHARRRERRREELRDQTMQLGSRVIEMSDAVELAEDKQLSTKYATATGLFDEAETAITSASTMHELDGVAGTLEQARGLLDEVASTLSPNRR